MFNYVRIPYEVLISKLNSWYITIKKKMTEEAQNKKSEMNPFRRSRNEARCPSSYIINF